YNTCFALRDENTTLLVDAGGGNGILRQLREANIAIGEIHDMFVTHAHTDHIIGALWVIRMFLQQKAKGICQGFIRVYGHEKVIRVIQNMMRDMLPQKLVNQIGVSVLFKELHDRDVFHVGDMRFQCFDILSTKEKQFGFTAWLADGQRLVCLGDEPYNEHNRSLVENADWLMSEAFCKYADRDVFKPYEKHHSTVKDAAQLAEELGVSNLILYHTEDKTILTRKQDYTAEASEFFHGNIFVPDDLEIISLNS
ncbi:MAG: MBL fold metallo-hydrolase, partial [Prevotella sp.]|nr:MBL fold metallo-hydrolase [Prevotella sp.]